MRRFTLSFAIFLSISMSPAYADPSDANPTTASNPDQAVKCRKVQVTGSLLKKGKVCRTIAEWKRIQSNGNRTARAIAESGNICSGGCCGNGACSGQ
jgi:hypothetical protein